MTEGLKGLVICVLGGDYREIELIRRFLAEGAQVRVVGYPPLDELEGDCQGKQCVPRDHRSFSHRRRNGRL